MGGISNTVGRGFENTVHFRRTLRHQAMDYCMSKGTARQKSQPRSSREVAPTVFENPLISCNTCLFPANS